MASGQPVAKFVRLIAQMFPRGIATTRVPPHADDPLVPGAFENSPAGRQVHDLILSAVVERDGLVAYALRITQAGGLVTGLTRRTNTDHFLATCRSLKQSLQQVDSALARQGVALHDPYLPVTVQEVQHA